MFLLLDERRHFTVFTDDSGSKPLPEIMAKYNRIIKVVFKSLYYSKYIPRIGDLPPVEDTSNLCLLEKQT